MTPEADLLEALLALHLGFARREQVLEAAFAWADEPGRPVAGLGEAERRGVEAAAAALRDKYGGDAGRALAAAPVEASVHRALLGLRLPAPLPEILGAMKPRADGSGERYRLGAEIGRGGLGRVLESVDTTLGREVAIKLVIPDLPAVVAERFEREARLTAKLDHPNVVPVHDFGRIAGPKGAQLFLCMKRVKGRSLAEIVAALARGDVATVKAWSRARLLGVLQDICLGAAYAHSKGVIHRDLKPSNVMIGDFGETLILDWGLARETGDPPEPDFAGRTRLRAPKVGSSTLTMEGDVLGTPAYMPPEQAAGRLNDMDARSDVFSLGAILFELLTLRPPYVGATPDAVLARAQAGKVPAPSSVAADVPPGLDAICARACASSREDRYPTALALHHDLQLFLEGVAERDRMRKEAEQRVSEARRLAARVLELRSEITDAVARVLSIEAEVPKSAPEAERKRVWAVIDRHRSLCTERLLAFERADALFAEALAADPSRSDAREGRIAMRLERYFEAEEKREQSEMRVERAHLDRIDPAGTYLARIEAPGKLSVSAFEFTCDCLAPLKPGELKVEFGAEPTIAWRGGAPVPGSPLNNLDRPIPEVRVSPGAARLGHREGCPKRPCPGVRVSIARTVERDRRLVLEPEVPLGVTPLRDVSLPQGSWRCRLTPPPGSGLAEALLPVRITRGGSWSQDVALYRERDVPAGFVQVPAGPYIAGGGDEILQTRDSRDLFVAAFQVTCGEYLEFLNDERQRDPEAARRRLPRELEKPFWIEDKRTKKFRLPAAGEDPKYDWDPSWPVIAITWWDAAAYVAWRSSRDGRLYSFPHEDEYDKFARGVDGRTYPYGEHTESCWTHTAPSLATRVSPAPVGHFAADTSPYGVRDASGGASTWCLNAGEPGSRDLRIVRGLSWYSNDRGWGCAQRMGGPPGILRLAYGLRLCWRPWEWAARGEEPARKPKVSKRK